jgi:hypothetical protein
MGRAGVVKIQQIAQTQQKRTEQRVHLTCGQIFQISVMQKFFRTSSMGLTDRNHAPFRHHIQRPHSEYIFPCCIM